MLGNTLAIIISKYQCACSFDELRSPSVQYRRVLCHNEFTLLEKNNLYCIMQLALEARFLQVVLLYSLRPLRQPYLRLLDSIAGTVVAFVRELYPTPKMKYQGTFKDLRR